MTNVCKIIKKMHKVFPNVKALSFHIRSAHDENTEYITLWRLSLQLVDSLDESSELSDMSDFSFFFPCTSQHALLIVQDLYIYHLKPSR